MTMLLARAAVMGAVLCTLWFNGSYAYAKAAGDAHQVAMIALALTIDLCKCAFLPAAAHLASQGFRLRATVLVVLWPLAFSWSLYSGYSSLTTNRTLANVTTEGDAATRTRAQADYDHASATLVTARRSPLWEATAACTAPKSIPHRQFCDAVARAAATQRTAAAALNATKPVHVDPEVTALAAVVGVPRDRLLFWLAFAPALILELLSSFGAYAISSAALKSTTTPSDAFWRRWLMRWRPPLKTQPVRPLDAPPAPPAPSSAWIVKR